MSHLAYVGILSFVLAGCLWLEVVLRTRVFARWRRLLLSIAPVVVVFAVWDAYAIAQGHWAPAYSRGGSSGCPTPSSSSDSS